MNHPALVGMTRRLLSQIQSGAPLGYEVGEVPTWRYTSDAHFARERSTVFARVPQAVALAQEFHAPGACMSVDLAGVSVLLSRGQDGALRAFRNACRHRGTRLLAPEEGICRKKALVCPYHGWTYDLAGHLVHVPHEESFAGRCSSRADLVGLPIACRHGFVWAALEPFDLDAHLAPFDEELAEIGLGTATIHARRSRTVRANWKLLVDAFLEAYHVRHLHRNTIYRFFLDASAEFERAGPHIRAVVGRRPLIEVDPTQLEVAQLRELVTPTYFLYPNTFLAVSPDYVNAITIEPLSVDSTRFVDTMLIPQAPASAEEHARHDKSFELLDDGVFGAEDLPAAEAMQRGLECGANDTLLFGALESAALWFHQTIDRDTDPS